MWRPFLRRRGGNGPDDRGSHTHLRREARAAMSSPPSRPPPTGPIRRSGWLDCPAAGRPRCSPRLLIRASRAVFATRWRALLTVAQCAVMVSARTLLAIVNGHADTDRTAPRCPTSESTHKRYCITSRRSGARWRQVDAAAFDRAVAAWIAVKVGHLQGRQIIAIDGKTMRPRPSRR